ncbi:CARDB domain-containing protein [Tepidiforma sp.]|uniref:CARDB domain-containing protein n=1 Tax=Tepidiforma sp. TaxID=2682230 RepID=UPI002ADE7D25|nr:CARDB domain-containing protein [Tepidiforma sp.]
MSNRYGSTPDDEPVIGATYPPPSEPVIGADLPPRQQWYTGDTHYEEAYPEDDGWEDEIYYGEEPYDEPVRQPMFYVFLVLAAVVAGILVFLLFNLVAGGGNGGGSTPTGFDVQIDSPSRDQRIEINQPQEVAVQATATERIVRMELYVGDRMADSVDIAAAPEDNRYRATLRYTLATKGTYQLFVRVIAESGATQDSAKVRVVAIEPVGERPQQIRGRVVADATLRAGPGEEFEEAGRVLAGSEIAILGKSRDVTWLLVQGTTGSPGWVRRAAIEPLDTLDLVPTRDVTPTPAPEPTATAVPSPSPSPSASPSPSPNAPDFVPTNAVLANGGSLLRVTISNVSNNAYNGPLVVAVGGDVPQQEQAVSASLPANGGSTVVEFTVDPPVTSGGKRAVVTIDPANVVKELREDNNIATFSLLPPEEPANLVITSAQVTATAIEVVVRNDGGAMPASNVVVQVQLGAQTTSNSVNIALAPGQSSPVIIVPRPTGSGTATVTVFVGNQPMASTTVNLP